MVIQLFRKIRRNKGDITGLAWTSLAVFFIIIMVYQPAVVFEGAAEGLKIWWEVVFPSLLPFFVASELLMKLGFVNFLGILLDPIMRPLFNVPGFGGFVLVMGLVGGAPTNGLLVSELREKQLCTKSEAERLLCFTNFATPLFMISAVAVGMLGRPGLGIVIAGSHYLANIILGFGLRFYKRSEAGTYFDSDSISIKRAFMAMVLYQRKQKQTIGKLLNDSVTSSILKILNIGGFIILFSVIVRVFAQLGMIGLITSGFAVFLAPLGFSVEIVSSIASGLFETTIGSTAASKAAVTELQKLISIGFMLGWGGLSVHAQVASMVAKTDIGMRMFFVTRIVHAFLAAGITWLLHPSSQHIINFTLPAIAPGSRFCGYSTPQVILSFFFLASSFLLLLVLFAIILQWGKQIARRVKVLKNRYF